METEMTKIENLQDWYFDQCLIQEQRANSHSKYLFGGIKILMYFVGFFLLTLILKLLLSVYGSIRDPYYFENTKILSSEYFSFAVGFIIVLIYSTIAWLIFLLSWEKINLFQSMIEKEKVFIIPNDKGLKLKKGVEQLTIKMGIDYSLISFWCIINKDKYPSIEEDNLGRINLLLPVNFFSYFTKNQEEALAILAHEFGHILQKDTKLYLVTDAYFEIIRKLYLPVAILNLVIHIGILFSSGVFSKLNSSDMLTFITWIIFIWDFSLIAYLYNGFISLRETRRVSEKLADTAAVIFSNGHLLKNVLQNIDDVSLKLNPIATHPNKLERIENISLLLNTQ